MFLYCIHLLHCRISAFFLNTSELPQCCQFLCELEHTGMFAQTVPSIWAYFRLNHTYQFNIHFFFPRKSWKYLPRGTTAIKSEWGLWPGMPLHADTFTHLMAVPSSVTCSVLTGTRTLLSANAATQKPSLSSLFLLYWIRGAFLYPQFNPSHVDVVKWKWAVLPLRTCFGLKEVAELKH